MFTWCTILFLLGITAFLDSLFNYGEIFRRVNSVLFMLVSLGLLVRTTTKMKMRRIETYIERIERLEEKLRNKPENTPTSTAPRP
jgi:phage-related holin